MKKLIILLIIVGMVFSFAGANLGFAAVAGPGSGSGSGGGPGSGSGGEDNKDDKEAPIKPPRPEAGGPDLQKLREIIAENLESGTPQFIGNAIRSLL